MHMAASGLEEKFNAREGLQALIAIPELGEMHGRLPPVDFFKQALAYARSKQDAAKDSPQTARVWGAYVNIAEQLLSIERRGAPIPFSPLDAEPRMLHRDGSVFVVVGGGPQEGGYATELREEGENCMIWR